MKILQVNKYHYPRGGADKYFLDLSDRLKVAGHQVAVFCMQHPKNIPSDYDKYFVSRVSFNENLGLWNKLKIPARVIYSLEAKFKFKKLLEDFKPDIIHLHNIYHQISPSILDVARKKKIPVVMHLHDYKLVCPNHTLFVNAKNCDRCKGAKYFHCIRYRCLKDSFAASLLATIEMFIHHSILKIYQKGITLFIAPSTHMKDTCVFFSWPENKFRVIYNSYSPELQAQELPIEDYLLYFGRLGAEKGISTLLQAAAKTNSRIKIAGVGEEEENLKKEAKDLNLEIDFLGFKSGQELANIISKAKAIVMPSIWSENMPLSLLEAMNMKKVVIASRIGGFPEIITDTQNGFLFEAGNSDDLAEKIKSLARYSLQTIAEKAKLRVSQLTPENNLKEVLELYKEILNKE